jgi:hypothetical protein
MRQMCYVQRIQSGAPSTRHAVTPPKRAFECKSTSHPGFRSSVPRRRVAAMEAHYRQRGGILFLPCSPVNNKGHAIAHCRRPRATCAGSSTRTRDYEHLVDVVNPQTSKAFWKGMHAASPNHASCWLPLTLAAQAAAQGWFQLPEHQHDPRQLRPNAHYICRHATS